MEKSKIQPLNDRVLVQRVEEEEVVKGGIYIPDSAREKPQQARVVALGTGGKDEDGKPVAFQLKAGDRVLITKYGGTEVKLGDETYLIIRESDVLAILG